jgi:hypothetical protein
LFPLFVPGVNDTGGNFAAGVVDTGSNLPPASLTPAANLPPVSLNRWQRQQHKRNWWQNLPPVSPLTCEYLREFSKKFEMTLMPFSEGKVIREKNLKQKIS